MAKLFGALVELVVKVGLLFAYWGEPLLALWHALEVLCAAVHLASQVVKSWRSRRQTRR